MQANVIASATGALLWLAMRRHIYGRLEISLSSGPLLAAQVSLGVLGNVLLLGLPLLTARVGVLTALGWTLHCTGNVLVRLGHLFH